MTKFVYGLRFTSLAAALVLSTWPALAQLGSTGGSNSKFDGTWSVTSVGCGNRSGMVFTISSGKFIGEGLSGGVSPSGVSNSFWSSSNGQVTSNGTGHFSVRSGSGSFLRNDGCSGKWSAIKL